eukprot:1142261-Pelagomonas_calceolata.AAC.5
MREGVMMGSCSHARAAAPSSARISEHAPCPLLDHDALVVSGAPRNGPLAAARARSAVWLRLAVRQQCNARAPCLSQYQCRARLSAGVPHTGNGGAGAIAGLEHG